MEATQEAAQARLDHTLSVLRSENLRGRRRAGGLPAAAGPGQRRRHLPPGSDRDRDPAARSVRMAPLRRRRPGPRRTPRRAGYPRRGDAGCGGAGGPMTIIAGFSSSRQGSAPLNLAAQVARTTGDKIVAAAIVERALTGRCRSDRGRVPGLSHVVGKRGAGADGRPGARRSRHLRGGPPSDLDTKRSDGARGSAQRRCRGGRVVVLGPARQDRPRQCDVEAGAHLAGASGDRPARLSVESRYPFNG